MAKESKPVVKTVKPWTPTNRNIQTTADRANEKRVNIRYLKPEIPFVEAPPNWPEGIIQSHRESIADNYVRKGIAEYVKVSEAKKITKVQAKASADQEAAADKAQQEAIDKAVAEARVKVLAEGEELGRAAERKEAKDGSKRRGIFGRNQGASEESDTPNSGG